MKILKVEDGYINLENVTHVEFETSEEGMMATVFFACQITDPAGATNIQASKTFTAAAAERLRAFLELRSKQMHDSADKNLL